MSESGSTLVHHGSTEVYSTADFKPLRDQLRLQKVSSTTADDVSKSSKRSSYKQPPNTVEYKVKCTDKLTSLAAFYDTTPSALKKLNRLTVDYLYPDQLLYVPIVRQTSADSQCNSVFSISSGSDTHNDSDFYSCSSCEEEKPDPGSKKSSLQNSDVHNRTWVPEDSPRALDLDTSILDSSIKAMEGAQSNSDRQHPQQRFVKLSSSYIIPDKSEVVRGTLLVTPNAVMFDPNVSDPLVLEKGVEEFGMIAKMDTIISAAIYRDGQAMHNLQRLKVDPTVRKPKVYHIEDCELQTDVQQSCTDGTESNDPTDPRLSCSCSALQSVLEENCRTDITSKKGSGSISSDFGVSRVTFNVSDNDISNAVVIKSEEDAIRAKSITKVNDNIKEGKIESADDIQNKHTMESADDVRNEQNTKSADDIKKEEGIICASSMEVKDTVTEDRIKSADNIEKGHDTESADDINNPDSTDLEDTIKQNHCCPTEGSNTVGLKINVKPKLSHCRNVSSTSSICCVSVGSATNLYVDYGSGIFASNADVSVDSETIGEKERCEDDVNAKPYQLCNDRDKNPVFLKAGVGLDEKPHLFKPISDLVHSPTSEEPSCQPFYLCLQVGERVNKCRIIDTCPIEAYKKKKRRPEYWFTIPKEQVNSLYNFFIQWRPELYGEEITDIAILGSRGFISIPENNSTRTGDSSLPRSPMIRQLSHTKVVKDWEILSLDEIARRKSLLDLEKYLPFPDMQGNSLLLSEQDIKQLAASLPARVEGHQWKLAYSNEDNGFSLSTLYRNMCEYDSATILLVQDENNGLFGAFSSAPLYHREHFFGNGECYLFTFVDGFKTYEWTGKNLFCVRGDSEGITIGTGTATCGLWVDADLYHGRTQHCDTFDNEPLTGGQEDFIIKAVEVWSLNDEFMF